MHRSTLGRHLPTALIALTWMIASGVPPLVAQELAEIAATPTNTFTESVAVRVVNVEVFVTDKKGRPVGDLTADDFELYEDGRRVEITNFFAAEDELAGRAVATEATRSSDDGPVAAVGGDSARPPTLVVYIDNFNLRPAGRKRVLDDLKPFLAESVAAGARVMVAIHGPEGLRPLLSPTSDPAAIEAALAEVEATTAQGLRADAARRTTLRQIADLLRQYDSLPQRVSQGPCDLADVELEYAVEDYARNQLANLEITANGLSIMVGALAGWPGLKSLIYVSDGLPEFAGTEMYAYLSDICPENSETALQDFGRFDSSSIIEQITQRANANRVTIHTLEALGLTTYSSASVESEGRLLGRSFTPSAGNDRIRSANLQSTLYHLADSTGGRAILNANDFAQDLEEIGTDARNYYSLGFNTRQYGDDRVHRLRVEVASDKYRVRHRKAYRDKPIEDTLAERTLGALIFDLEDNGLGAVVETRQVASQQAKSQDGAAQPVATSPTVDTASDQEMLVEIRIPYAALAMLPSGEQWTGRLRLVLTARDVNNNLLPIKQKIVPVMTPNDPAAPVQAGTEGAPAGDVAQLDIGIGLDPGEYELALAIRDEIAGTTSFMRRVVTMEAQPSVATASTRNE